MSWGNEHSFEELQNIINQAGAGDEITLDYDYSLFTGGDTLVINKPLTINGNNHVLDGAGLKRILTVNDWDDNGLENITPGIVLKNINFINGGACDHYNQYSTEEGGAIYLGDGYNTLTGRFNNLTLINCAFENNGASSKGGAISWWGDLTIIDSTFSDNTVDKGNGGAVYLPVGDVTINNARFENNKVKDGYIIAEVFSDFFASFNVVEAGTEFWIAMLYFHGGLGNAKGIPSTGGAIFSNGNVNVENSYFSGNKVGEANQIGTAGGAIHSTEKVNVRNSTFISNRAYDEFGGAIISEDDCQIYDSIFRGNVANCGGAVASLGRLSVYNSEFSNNYHEAGTTWTESLSIDYFLGLIPGFGDVLDFASYTLGIGGIDLDFLNLASQSKGGAVYSDGVCRIESCTFNNNYITEYGGAVYTNHRADVIDSKFTSNNVFRGENHLSQALQYQGKDRDAGAIHCEGSLNIIHSSFVRNSAPHEGGAVYVGSECNVYNSTFSSNTANVFGGAISAQNVGKIFNTSFTLNQVTDSLKSDGGAIYIKKNCNPNIENCQFVRNSALKDGGAIFVDSEDATLTVSGSGFFSNVADIDGGAFYCRGNTNIYSSIFEENKATGGNSFARSFGGAVNSKGNIYVENCEFKNNKAYKSSFGAARGGAIYTDSRLKIEGSTFTGNTAEGYGGAVYANIINEEISNSVFRQNRATDGDGGAIYIESETYPKVRFSTFEDNTATGDGGAIYTNHGGSTVSMVGSNFIRNSAQEGGAAYIIKGTEIHDCIFKQNRATDGDGGAIYMDDECYPSVVGCTFEENTATRYGGAIYTDHGGSQAGVVRSNFIRNSAKEGGALYVSKIYSNTPLQYCIFRGNRATDGDGGAIYIDNECYPKVWDSTFEENTATGSGGAIYTDHGGSQVSMLGSSFTANSAKEGGAAYISKVTEIDSCTFRGNRATGGDGGAVYIDNEAFPKVRFSTFEVNTASGRGGGIYTDHDGSQVSIVGSSFTGNSAQQGGGAAFLSKATEIENSKFKGNTAPHGHGGALFINRACNPYVFGGTVFEFNSAAGRGGGMYLDSNNAVLRIGTSENSRIEATFEGNAAAQGGGVYTGQLSGVTCAAFLGNRATAAEDGDGGGIYVNNACTFELWWSRFEDNLANNRGGAVYTDSTSCNINKLQFCTFVHNEARQRNYHSTSVYRGPGHDIFNSGTYTNLRSCWYGSNTPNFDNGRLIKYNAGVADTKVNPGKVGTMQFRFWHSCYETHGSDMAYVGNYYGVALVTWVYNDDPSANIYDYEVYHWQNWDPFYHSDFKVYGDKITVKYYTRNLRDGYAEFSVGKTGHNILYIQIDDEILRLDPLEGRAKLQPTVRIDSCEDVKYPNALKLTYTINPKTASSYVIKDSLGEIVKTGSLNPNQNTAYIEGLTPGSYSITISNSENSNYAAGSSTKTFNINKGDIGELRVVVYNKTYPEDVGCIVYASVDGEYTLTVGNATSVVTVTNGVGYINIGTLENGTYAADVNFTENDLYVSCSNSTTFVVYSQGNGTYFAVDINATEIDYGQTAIVAHALAENATGNITYCLSDGTFLGELPVNETLTLPVLEPGYYVIIANYTGDGNYASDIDSVGLMVNRLDSGFTAYAVDENGTVVYYVQYDQNPVVANLLDGNATGTIRYLFNGTLLGETPLCERYNLPKLDPGFYNIIAEYSGDGHFKNASANFNLYVTKSSSFIISINSSDSIPYGQNITVTHELPYDANGSIMYYLSDRESAEGERIFLGELPINETLTLPILDADVYSIFAVYSGDNNYDKSTYIREFVITPVSLEFSLNITTKKFIYGETPTVSPILPPVGGNVSYYLDDGTFLGEFSVVENFTLPILNGGTHIIIGKYSGDRNHLNATANITLIVYRAQPAFEVGVNESEIIYGSTTFVTFTLPANATGSIAYYLSDGTFLGELPINETLTLPILDAGSYVIIGKYSGDNNYLNAIANAILTVNKEQTEIFADMLSTTYGNDDYLVITVKDIKGNTIAGIDVSVDLNGVKNYTTDENGQIKVPTSGLDSGTYDATIIFNGARNYLNSSGTATVVINKMQTRILADMLNTTHWSKEDLLITLKDIRGNPIVGVNLTVDLNGTKDYTTDENGQIKVSTYDLDVGTYDAAIIFKGARNYLNSSNVAIVIINKTPAEILVNTLLDVIGSQNIIIESQKEQINALSKSSANTSKVVVSKKATKITAPNKTFKVKTKAKKYTITLKSDKKAVSKVKVTIKVGKKTYTAKTNKKGKATFNLKKLTKKGKYAAVIKFNGNKNYKATSKKVKIVLK